MTITKNLLLLLCITSIASCVSGTSIPQEHYYRLPAVLSEKPDAGNRRQMDCLLVRDVTVKGLLNDRSLLYVESKQPFEVKKYYYHQWEETPAVMVRDHLIDYLQSTAISKRVARFNYAEKNCHVLESSLEKMEIHYVNNNAELQVSMQADLRDPASQIMFSKHYQASHVADGKDIHTLVSAYREAFAAVYQQLAEDLVRVKK